jgi:hypothetical protein
MGKLYMSSFGVVSPCATRPEFSHNGLPIVAIVPNNAPALTEARNSEAMLKVLVNAVTGQVRTHPKGRNHANYWARTPSKYLSSIA